MSFFYSPFTDKKGSPLDIFHINHRHLSQLLSKEIEEGYQVEYKADLTDSVKKKIPKIITSFANSEGGWLFIGVDEKTHELDKLKKAQRTDYTQIISQLLREHVSPLPHFAARFFKSKASVSGVLVIYIFEGNNPPYVADGTVYVRNGSSSEPARSQRAEIDSLYQKRKDFDSKIEAFCVREVYYPMDKSESNQIVLCNIFIKNIGKHSKGNFFIHLDDLARKFLNVPTNQFHNYIFSNDSVVFQNSHVLGKYQIGINVEIFSDYSAKIHVPIQQINGSERNMAIDRLKQISGQELIDEFLLLDGYVACQCFQFIVQQYFRFLELEDIDASSFLYQMSLEDAENSILYFDSDSYESYVREHDIPYCCKETQQTKKYYFSGRKKGEHSFYFMDLLIRFFFMFGLNPADAAQMYADAVHVNPTRNITFK